MQANKVLAIRGEQGSLLRCRDGENLFIRNPLVGRAIFHHRDDVMLQGSERVHELAEGNFRQRRDVP